MSALRELLAGLDARVRGDDGVAVVGVTSDSRNVARGGLFVAVPGATDHSVHGNRFARAAADAGAAAILTDREGPETAGIPVVAVVQDARRALAVVAERFHGNPSGRLRLLGVTGTNGKTTTAHVLEAMATAAGEKAGFIGTTAVRLAGTERPATHTTPPADALCALLAEMVSAGVTTCGMEVSSHALDQGRVEGLHFAGGIFTNLTQDHLDYHRTMDAYFDAKARFFRQLLRKDAVAVLNADDERVRSLRGASPARTLAFSATGGKAEVSARRVAADAQGTTVEVSSPWGDFTLRTPLLGTYNVANVLGAAALHLATGTPREAVLQGAAELRVVPGRLERVAHPRGARVLVDYAHTDDALARALDAVRPNVGPGGRLFVVFGCGGDRDAGKRPRMGEAAARRADVVIVTSDNPRSEKPEAIADAILGGIRPVGMTELNAALSGRGFTVELDRKQAIAAAVRAAGPQDVVLIAGKGHEREQIFADRKVPFDDRLVAAEAMEGMPA